MNRLIWILPSRIHDLILRLTGYRLGDRGGAGRVHPRRAAHVVDGRGVNGR